MLSCRAKHKILIEPIEQRLRALPTATLTPRHAATTHTMSSSLSSSAHASSSCPSSLSSPSAHASAPSPPDWRQRHKSTAERCECDVRWTVRVAGAPPRELVLHQTRVSNVKTLGCCVWDSCLLLSAYFDHSGALDAAVAGRSVIELGAGTGLLSMAAALRGAARVLATDMDSEPVLSLLRRNMATNGLSERVQVAAHVWGTDPQPLSPPFDVVLAADVVFREVSVVPLLTSLARVLEPHSGIAWVAAEQHDAAAMRYFSTLLPLAFDSVEVIDASALPAAYRDDEGLVHVWRLRRPRISDEALASSLRAEFEKLVAAAAAAEKEVATAKHIKR